jgi:hypothetical protein
MKRIVSDFHGREYVFGSSIATKKQNLSKNNSQLPRWKLGSWES